GSSRTCGRTWIRCERTASERGREMIGRAVLLAGAVLALAVPAAGAASRSKAVATVSNAHYRAVVQAAKTSGGAAPTARASILVYARLHGSWERTRTQLLPGTYFWKTLTA